MKVQDIIKELQSLDTEKPGTWPLWVHISAVVLAALVVISRGEHGLREHGEREHGERERLGE